MTPKELEAVLADTLGGAFAATARSFAAIYNLDPVSAYWLTVTVAWDFAWDKRRLSWEPKKGNLWN